MAELNFRFLVYSVMQSCQLIRLILPSLATDGQHHKYYHLLLLVLYNATMV